MKFGVREICDVVLRAKTKMQVGSKTFYKNEPVLYFDTLTTSSLEGSATTSYAQGGRGNTRLMAWEGERTLTFNMTDALISPESFSVLSGASIYDAGNGTDAGTVEMFVHTTTRAEVKETTLDNGDWAVKVPGRVYWSHKASLKATDTFPSTISDDTEYSAGKDYWKKDADIFIMNLYNGEIDGEPEIPDEATNEATPKYPISYVHSSEDNQWYSYIRCAGMRHNGTVLVDYYVKQNKGKQIEITPDKFGGYFYLEASTLFRDEHTGQDLPAEFIIPNCKIQSNFTFTMSSTGDPSTFDFVLDAFPDYTKFDETKKVLAVIQVVEETAEEGAAEEQRQHRPANYSPSSVETRGFSHNEDYALGAATTTDTYAWTTDIAASTPRATITQS